MKLMSKEELVAFKDKLDTLNEVDIAELMTELPAKKRALVTRLLPKDELADVFHELPAEVREEILMDYSDRELADLIQEIESDDLVDTLQELPANMVIEMLEYVRPEKRPLINQMLHYPEESVGSLMSIDYITAREHATKEEVIEKVRHSTGGPEHNNIIYIISPHRILLGYVYLSEVIQSDDEYIDELVYHEAIHLSTHDDQEIAADLFNKYKLPAIPVVDSETRLVGIVTVDDIFQVISQETEEDIQLMAGIQQPDMEPYLEKSIRSMVLERLGWLMFLMISATFTGFIIQHYDAVLATHVALAAFIPMLMDSGGNAGTQASTLITRSLSLHELEPSDAGKVFKREFLIGLITGSALSLVNTIRLLIIGEHNLQLILTVNITLIATIILSKVIGGMLPIVASFFKQDPAVMAGPLITTLVDTFTLFVYFQIASALLGI